ncbi:MAG: serine/threonine-protein kinase [Polyangiaceae bacterium]
MPAIPAVGEVVAEKYQIDRMLAEGGMGVVYEATHLQLDEKVAIKFLRSDFTGAMSTELAGRFLREARASAKIRSEHVTRVYDVGTLPSGAPFIVMEKLNGDDLEQLVEKNGVLPIAKAIDYVLEACEALAEAHAIGIVHRDLKPANLFLTHRADGSSCVKVLDFGISKFKDSGTSGAAMSVTKTHAVMGSPRYMSPEQMRSTKDVDARADIWAIGIVLYELFAGTVPFDGESMPQICASILQDEPKPLRVLRPEITAELDAIVTRCLAKKAADRYQNIVPLAQELAAFGTSAAIASADRVTRVLEASVNYVNADTAPRAFTISNSPSGPIPSMRASTKPHAASGIATAIAWTEPAAPPKSRRPLLYAALGAAALLTFGATVFFQVHSHSDATPPGQVTSTAAETPAHTATPSTMSTTATADTAPTTTPTMIAAATTDPGASAVSASVATPPGKATTTKKSAPPAAHSVAAHAAAHPVSVATMPPTTPSSPAAATAPAPGDMWDERK